jgi:hypothetical protein
MFRSSRQAADDAGAYPRQVVATVADGMILEALGKSVRAPAGRWRKRCGEGMRNNSCHTLFPDERRMRLCGHLHAM